MITRNGYYQNLDVLFEIIHQCKDREVFFLPIDPITKKSTPPIRWLMAQYVNMLKRHFEQFHFLEKSMNIYHSLATYKNRPMFSYSWIYKSQEQEIWMKEFKNYITELDLFVETDCSDVMLAVEDARYIKHDVLDRFKIKYSLSFSGSKGVHCIVPYSEFQHLGLNVYDEKKERLWMNFEKFLQTLPVKKKDMDKNFDLVLLFKTINVRMKGIYAMDTIDASISDIKRVRKIPYSWDVKSGRIALPLTDEQLDNFNLDMVEPVNVLKAGVHKRGLLWRNADVDMKEREKGIDLLIEELGIVKD